MAKYTGKTARVAVPSSAIVAKFDDLSVMSDYADSLPEEQRAKIGDVRFEKDAIIIKNPHIGEMAFNVVERSADAVVFKADGMIPLTISVLLASVDDDTATDVTTVLDIEIPAMLKPLIGGKLQQVADTFGDLVAKLAASKSGI